MHCKTKKYAKFKSIRKDSGATIASTIFNLINTIIGSGCLMLPYDTKNTGFGFMVILNALIAILSATSFFFISSAAEYTQSFTYRGISDKVYKKWVGIMSTACLIVYTFGTCMSYTIIIKNNMFWWDNFGKEYKYKVFLMWGICLTTALPLGLLPKLDFLKYTSIAAIVAILYVIILTVSFSCLIMKNKDGLYNDIIQKRGELVPFLFTQQTAIALPLLGSAYTGHYNSATLYKELKNRNNKRMIKVISISLAICFIAYTAMGLFGYFAFGNSVLDNIIQNLSTLPSGKIFSDIACIFIMIVVITSFPLVLFSIKGNIATLIMGSTCVKKKAIQNAKEKHYRSKSNTGECTVTKKSDNNIDISPFPLLDNMNIDSTNFCQTTEIDTISDLNSEKHDIIEVERKEKGKDSSNLKFTSSDSSQGEASSAEQNSFIMKDFNNNINKVEMQTKKNNENDFLPAEKVSIRPVEERKLEKAQRTTKPLYELNENNERDLHSLEIPIKKKYDIIIGVIIVLIALLITSFVDSISDLVSFTGALCGTPIVFIFPSFFYLAILKEKKDRKKKEFIMPVIVLIFGFFFAIMGLYSAIYNQVNKRKI